MDFTTATLTIKGTAPYSQSRKHEAPKLQGESPGDYDIRTWREHMHVAEIDGKKVIQAPPIAIHRALSAAARYSKRQIPNQGRSTWTQKFESGIMLPEAPILNKTPDDAKMVAISANANGKRGTGTRVTRRFPHFYGWETTFAVMILDPIITAAIFSEMVELAGLFIGIGQFRPEVGGHNGRWVLGNLAWKDARRMAA